MGQQNFSVPPDTSLFLTTRHRSSQHVTVPPDTSLFLPTCHRSSWHVTVPPDTSLFLPTLHCSSLHFSLPSDTSLFLPTLHCSSLHFSLPSDTSLFLPTQHSSSCWTRLVMWLVPSQLCHEDIAAPQALGQADVISVWQSLCEKLPAQLSHLCSTLQISALSDFD